MYSTSDYLALIPSANALKPNFRAFLQAILDPLTEIQANTYQLLADFCLDTAVGVQLDQVGLWLGRSRRFAVPVDPVYFSWDTSGLGWDQGIWFNPYSPTTNVVNLDDTLYRIVLKTKALANQWDGTLGGMYPILDEFQAGTGVALTIKDNQNMTMTIGYTGTAPAPIYVAIIEQSFVPPRPVGVSFTYSLT